MPRWWSRAFLDARPSLSLGLFRVAVAFTVGAHMIPSLLHLDENYLSTAFKTQNTSFFPASLLALAGRSPDGLVIGMAAVFAGALAAFGLGWCTQASAIVLTLACYFFYAVNNFHIGTLSFDILLVTLVLLCLTAYPGDFLSVDSLRRGKPYPYKRRRPIFLQRLLQLQLVITFWHTALNKVAGGGNWLTDNPYYFLMHYPAIGVVRDFPLRAWLAQQPGACYALGLTLIAFEFALPVLWLLPAPRLRYPAIGLGILFQFMLWGTLHVPTIFLFLFPPMMLLFVAPERLVAWIERQQARAADRGRGLLLYDGRCGFCLESVKRLRVLDVFGWVDPLDFHRQPDLARIHPLLTPERCRSEMVLVEPDGRLSGGFQAFARFTLRLPMLMPLAPFAHLPGADWIGTRVYRWVAEHRYLLHRNPTCSTNACGLPAPPAGGNGRGAGGHSGSGDSSNT
jgi:predicted DCC family thiol-disulfide oxidoreductase YuxK